jgi:hypothetical protein
MSTDESKGLLRKPCWRSAVDGAKRVMEEDPRFPLPRLRYLSSHMTSLLLFKAIYPPSKMVAAWRCPVPSTIPFSLT